MVHFAESSRQARVCLAGAAALLGASDQAFAAGGLKATHVDEVSPRAKPLFEGLPS